MSSFYQKKHTWMHWCALRNALLMVRYDVVSAYYATDDRDIQSCFKLLFVYAPVIGILC